MTIPDEHFIELSFDAAGNPNHKFQLASITPSPSAPSTPAPTPLRHSVSGPSSTSGAGSGVGANGSAGGSGDSRDLGNDLFESLGPFTDSDHHANVNAEAGYSLTSSLLLLHRRFPPHRTISVIHSHIVYVAFRFSSDDPIHTLAFLPEYAQQTEDNSPPLSSGIDASTSFGTLGSSLPSIIAMHILPFACSLCIIR
jgi:hypothetical protein